MYKPTKALDFFVPKSPSFESNPAIGKNLEIEKNKLRDEKNSFIIKVF